MKETIAIKIIEGGKAREVNPLVEKPDLIKIPICNNLGASFKAEQDYLFNLKKFCLNSFLYVQYHLNY